MGVMDKFLNAINLNSYDEEDYDEDYYDEGEIIDNTVRKPAPVEERDYNRDYNDDKKTFSSQKVTPIRAVKKAPGDGMEVCVIKAQTVDDAREVVSTLLSGRSVVLNLEGIEIETAQRIIDYVSGAIYALSGNLQKISNFIFIVTPKNVSVSGDFPDIVSGAFDVPLNSII